MMTYYFFFVYDTQRAVKLASTVVYKLLSLKILLLLCINNNINDV